MGYVGVGFVLDYHLGHYLGPVWDSVLGFHLQPDDLNWPSFIIISLLIFLALLSLILVYIANEMSSSSLFTSIMINIESLLYKIRNSSLILRIPDEPPCYVR